MVVESCLACARNGYPKSGMSLATKSLGSLRPSSLCRPCSSSRTLTNFLRCIRGRVTLPLMDVDVRWMAIAYDSTKLDDCPTLSDLWNKWLSQEWDELCHQVFGKLKTKFTSPLVLNFVEFDKPFEVHMGTSDFTIGGCWCKMDGHCICEHEARWLSKKTTNSWKRISLP